MPRCPVIIPLNVTQSRVFAVRSPANGNAADAGNGDTSSSGTVTTTSASELLVAANQPSKLGAQP